MTTPASGASSEAEATSELHRGILTAIACSWHPLRVAAARSMAQPTTRAPVPSRLAYTVTGGVLSVDHTFVSRWSQRTKVVEKVPVGPYHPDHAAFQHATAAGVHFEMHDQGLLTQQAAP